MKPTKKKKIDYSRAWAEARKLIWHNRWRLALGLVLMLASRAAGMVLPYSTKFLVDNVFGQKQYEMLWVIALVVGLAAVFQSATSFALSQVLGVAAQRAITEMRKRVQAHIERLPTSYFDSTQTGQLISRIMRDAEGIRNLVGTGLGQIIGGLLSALVSMAVLFYLNWQITLITLAVLGVFGYVLSYAFKQLRPLFRDRGEIEAEVTGRLNEGLGGIRIVKAYTAEKREELSFARGAHKLFRNIAKSMTGVSATGSFAAVVIGAIAVVMIWFGGSAVIANIEDPTRGMTSGDFTMYIAFTIFMVIPIVDLANIGTQITEAFAGLDRISDVFSMRTEVDEDANKAALPRLEGSVDFEDVHFEYEADVPVLKGISFAAPAGSTTALVGSSGSGKSTILSLVLNFIQPNRGRVMVDGRDLNSVKLQDYRRHLGVVLQDNFLFDGTILSNIRFANPHANFDEIREVCRIANADSGRLRGSLVYAIAGLRAWRTYVPIHARVTGPFGSIGEEVLIAAFANSPRYGGGLRLAPSASIDDGRLDIVIVKRMSALAVLAALPALIRGKHLGHRAVRFERGVVVSLDCQPGTPLYADGELIGLTGPTSTKMECIPGALQVAVASDAAARGKD